MNEADEPTALQLAEQLSLPPLIGKLLVLRGIATASEAEAFLGQPDDRCFHDPYLLKGMDAAVHRLKAAIDAREKIRIYGDYDADGVSSTALASFLLHRLGAVYDAYIPHRVHEGYGLNPEAIDAAKRKGVSLILTVDNGISAVEQIRYAREQGIDVVVTDHHEPPETLPDAACAIVNPKQRDCTYPYEHFAGVGVVAKLAQAMLGSISGEMAQLAALGTIADVMPLTGENRALVKLGLAHMRTNPLPGLKALLGAAGVDYREVSASHIGFAVGPRINASGRLDSADAALKTLLAEAEQEAEHAAFQLDQLNKERQRIVEAMNKEAAAQVQLRYPDGRIPKFLVVSGESWNPGVIGIVAAKLVETWYRPCIAFSVDPETGLAKGSARSIDGFDLHRAMLDCQDLLEHFGGHQAAAGMSVRRDKLEELESRLQRLAEQRLTPDQLVPQTTADASCSIEDVTLDLIEQLRRLEPFGAGNPAPRFVIRDAGLDAQRAIGKESQHLKLTLRSSRGEAAGKLDAIAFGKGKLLRHISAGARIELLAELDINEWNGMRKPQLLVQDLRVPHRQVFDWRGAKPNDSRIAEWLEHAGADSAVLWFEHGYAGEPPALEPSKAALVKVAADSLRELAAKLSGFKHVLIANRPRSLDDLRDALRTAADAECWYAWFGPMPNRPMTMPRREHFKLCYGQLRAAGEWSYRDDGFVRRLSQAVGLQPDAVRHMIGVFEELEFIERSGDVGRCKREPAKRDLQESRSYRERQLAAEVDDMITYADSGTFLAWMESRLEITKIMDEMEEAI